MSLTIENLTAQLNQLINLREQYAQAFQQVVGQINLIQQQIKMLMDEEAKHKAKGEQQDGGTNSESAGETA